MTRAVLLVSVVLVASAVACGTLQGAADDATPDSDAGGDETGSHDDGGVDAEAGDASVADARFCEGVDATFCEDFDDSADTTIGNGWAGVDQDGGLSYDTTSPKSAPRSLHATGDSVARLLKPFNVLHDFTVDLDVRFGPLPTGASFVAPVRLEGNGADITFHASTMPDHAFFQAGVSATGTDDQTPLPPAFHHLAMEVDVVTGKLTASLDGAPFANALGLGSQWQQSPTMITLSVGIAELFNAAAVVVADVTVDNVVVRVR
jgi:hypothetical protein